MHPLQGSVGSFWQGRLVCLRPPTGADWETICAEEEDSEGIRAFEAGIQPPRSPEQLKESLDRYAREGRPGMLGFAVESLAGELVGSANIRDWQNRQGTFTFAIRIYRAYRHRGYAADAVRILLRYGFYELRCQKANSATLASNEASIALHCALGFRQEGRIRRNCYTDGRYQDELLFGMTREEFDEVSGTSEDLLTTGRP